MPNFPVGKPIAEDTNEIRLKWLQHQIAERKSAIARLKQDISDLAQVRLPQLEEMLLRKENEINVLLGQQSQQQAIDVTSQ